EDKIEEKTQPLEDVKNQLLDRVLFEKKKNTLEQFIENALKEAGVEQHLDRIEANAPKQPVPVPRH
ncbi:MAG: hypothetical protein WC291_10710, partial [Thermodesulfovibrionales bacterium]